MWKSPRLHLDCIKTFVTHESVNFEKIQVTLIHPHTRLAKEKAALMGNAWMKMMMACHIAGGGFIVS